MYLVESSPSGLIFRVERGGLYRRLNGSRGHRGARAVSRIDHFIRRVTKNIIDNGERNIGIIAIGLTDEVGDFVPLLATSTAVSMNSLGYCFNKFFVSRHGSILIFDHTPLPK